MSSRLVCLRCGQVVDSAESVCPRCGVSFRTGFPNLATSPGTPPPATAPAGGTPTTSLPLLGRAAPSHLLRIVLTLVVVAVVALVLAFTVPISHPFLETLSTSDHFSESQFLYFPSNAGVSGSWNATGGAVSLSISTSSVVIYSGGGTSGSFSFTAKGLAYLLVVRTTSVQLVQVQVAGSYSSPLI